MPDSTIFNLGGRVRAGLTRRANWFQLTRFLLVGGSCYLINLATFALAVEVAGLQHLVGATIAFLVSVTAAFFGHRGVTFRATHVRILPQALRFISVYVPGGLLAAGILQLGVVLGLHEVIAQGISQALVVPVNFTANKIWSFAHPREAIGGLD
jgi:putative flippase GtrA